MDSNSDGSSDDASNEPQTVNHGPIPIPSSPSAQNPTSQDDPMDTTSPKTSNIPTTSKGDSNGSSSHIDVVGGETISTSNGSPTAAVTTTAMQQPKVVQTAFIHKLYGMLEDQNIQHVISWTRSGESFMISPTTEFSKVLASFFKHTNISSFVRQLNMYGFHKVSDVFATGNESPLWEFRHGNGNFKRGDLVGLREIKRRASKQQPFIQRDAFATPQKMAPPHSGMQPEAVSETVETRISMLEYNLHDVYGRLSRSEDTNAHLSMKYQHLSENLMKCLQCNHDMANIIMSIMQDPSNPAYRDALSIQKDMAQHIHTLKSQDESTEPTSTHRQSLFTHNPFDPSAPLSPRQTTHEDNQRRHSLTINPRSGHQRPIIPIVNPSPSRSFLPIGNHMNESSPPALRARQQHLTPSSQTQPAHQHPLATAVSPPANLSRRHTSADIREHGWQVPNASSFPSSNNNSSPWSSSPHRTPHGTQNDPPPPDSRFPQPSKHGQSTSRQTSPPAPDLPHSSSTSNLPASSSSQASDSGWIVPGSRWTWAKTGGSIIGSSAFGGPGGFAGGVMSESLFHSSSGPPTRRSSMASNVHNLLNPAETVEREDEDDDQGPLGPGGVGSGDEARGKRKRMG